MSTKANGAREDKETMTSLVNRYRYLLATANLSQVSESTFKTLCQVLGGTATEQTQDAKNGLLSSLHAQLANLGEVAEAAACDGIDSLGLVKLEALVAASRKNLLAPAKVIEHLDELQCQALLSHIEEVLSSNDPDHIESRFVTVFNKMQMSDRS